MASHILWICNRYGAVQRVTHDGARKRAHTSSTEELVCSLPGAPWQSPGWHLLQDIFRQFPAAEIEDCARDENLRGHVVAAVVVGPLQHYEGPLQQLGSEEHFLFQLHSRCAGSFLQVLAACCIAEPMLCNHFSGEYRPHCMCFAISPSSLGKLLQVRAADDDRSMTEVIDGWKVQYGLGDAVFDSCLQVWAPLAFATGKGAWKVLYIASHNRIESRCSVAPVWKREGREFSKSFQPEPLPDQPAPLTSAKLRALADSIRSLAAMVLDGSSFVDLEANREALIADIQWLERHAELLDRVSSADMEGFGRYGSQQRYRLMSLMHIFFLSCNLRQQGELRSVLSLSLQVLLPSAIGKTFIDSLHEKRLPSASTLSRFSQTLDFGFMVWMRSIMAVALAAPLWPSLHLMTDSSPQGGVDFLNSSFLIIQGDKLATWLFAAQQLVNLARARRPHEDDGPSEDAVEEAQCMDVLDRTMRIHHCAPVGLGARHTGTLHKAHALFQQLWLETGAPLLLSNALQAADTLTADMGTEASLTNMQPVFFRQMFPHLGEAPLDDDGDLFAAVGEHASGDASLSLKGCLYVPGGLHIVHNASQDAVAVASGFEEVLDGMRAVSGFLGDKLTRNLYFATCLTGVAAPLQVLFEGFSESLVGWRWASLWSCVRKFVELEDSLRATWDEGKISGKRGKTMQQRLPDDPEGVQKGLGAHLEKATAAISSPFFWAYMKMLYTIGVVAEHIFAWLESCACHSDLSLGALNWCTARQHFARLHSGVRACPLRGRRGPELAAGDLQKLVSQVSRLNPAHVMFGATGGLTASERRRVMSDFETVKQSLTFTLQLKFSCWSRLPHLLVGLGHYSEDSARDVAHRAIGALSCFPSFDEVGCAFACPRMHVEGLPQMVPKGQGQGLPCPGVAGLRRPPQ